MSSGSTSDFVGRRCVLEIQDGGQLTGSTDTQFTPVVPKTIQGFMTIYETSRSPAIMADAISC